MRAATALVFVLTVGACASTAPDTSTAVLDAEAQPSPTQPAVSPSVSPRRAARRKDVSAPPYPDPDPTYVASPSDEQEARVTFLRGQLAYEAGDYTEALRAFEETYARVPKVQVLHNIAETLIQTGDIERACATFAIVLRVQPDARRQDFPTERCPHLAEP